MPNPCDPMKYDPQKTTPVKVLMATLKNSKRTSAGARRKKKMMNKMRQADVILGYNFAGEYHTLFYGREKVEKLLAEMEAGRMDSHLMKILTFSYDSRTNELETLAVCCEIVFGKCDYQANPLYEYEPSSN